MTSACERPTSARRSAATSSGDLPDRIGVRFHILAAVEALAPLRIRLLVFAVLLAIAIVSIVLIDRRAMQRMAELKRDPAPGAAAEE